MSTGNFDQLFSYTRAVETAINRVVIGRPGVVRTAITALLAEGHLLVEDVPGVGKTTLARVLARTTGGVVGRIQFTPDLLPSDITGVNIYKSATAEFEFRPGPIFANVVIADEINRASPKTQSALLEAMQERHVTIEGHRHDVPRPFLIVATQNPIEMAGTFPLPEAQRDRFMACISMGYPGREAEIAMLESSQIREDPVQSVPTVGTLDDLTWAIARTRQVFTAAPIRAYVVDLLEKTRRDPHVNLGASPRAGLQLLSAARANAACEGRDYVIPEDVQKLAVSVLAHRIQLTPEAKVSGRDTPTVIGDAVRATAVNIPPAEPVRAFTQATHQS